MRNYHALLMYMCVSFNESTQQNRALNAKYPRVFQYTQSYRISHVYRVVKSSANKNHYDLYKNQVTKKLRFLLWCTPIAIPTPKRADVRGEQRELHPKQGARHGEHENVAG